jgi:Cu2+-exporting ATPase
MMSRPDQHITASPLGGTAIAELDLRNSYDASEYADLESYVVSLPGVISVHLDRTRGKAHIGYDPKITAPKRIEHDVFRCGYRCECHERASSAAQPGHPRPGSIEHAVMPGTGVSARPVGRGAVLHREHAGHGAGMVADLLRRSWSRRRSHFRCWRFHRSAKNSGCQPNRP